uniref:Thyrotropin-releasing hormone receptor n=1 Tax=Rhinolophus ferrumequinum TaxID=59479 RepID=A0A671FHW7_RHIFE
MENGSKLDNSNNVSLVHGATVLGSIEYRTVSVFLVLLVCTVGIVVSLALADLIVLVAAGLPNVSDSLAGQWVYGHAGCLGITYLQYLGINVSSCSILAFTPYITICHPMWAQTVCTVARAKRIIAGVWGSMSVYCLLWLFLVDLNVSESQGLECGYKVSHSLYLPIYLLDFTVFFIMPVLVTTVLYVLIGTLLFRSSRAHLTHHGGSEAWPESGTKEGDPHGPGGGKVGSYPRPKSFPSSRKQVTKMLVVVVLLFAVLWMPYRTLVLLNSFVAQPFLDPWVLLFCRTCVYTNSAINPVIYSLMSQKFRVAFRQLCRCGAEGPQRHAACLSTTTDFSVETCLGVGLSFPEVARVQPWQQGTCVGWKEARMKVSRGRKSSWKLGPPSCDSIGAEGWTGEAEKIRGLAGGRAPSL